MGRRAEATQEETGTPTNTLVPDSTVDMRAEAAQDEKEAHQ